MEKVIPNRINSTCKSTKYETSFYVQLKNVKLMILSYKI